MKKLVQYIVKKEKYKAEYPSKTRLIKRLMSFKPQWKNYFMEGENEENGDMEDVA